MVGGSAGPVGVPPAWSGRPANRARGRRWSAIVALCAVLSGLSVSQPAGAEDLRHRQAQVQRDSRAARLELSESSARLSQASRRFADAVEGLREARSELRQVRGLLDGARVRDRVAESELEAAERRLVEAREDAAEGESALTSQQTRVTSTVVSIYQDGDPRLLGFVSMLRAGTPGELTRRMQAQSAIVSHQTRAYDEAHAAAVLLRVREERVEAARRDVGEQRRAAAARLSEILALTRQARDATAKVRESVGARRQARIRATQLQARDRAVLQRLEQREAGIRRRILNRARRSDDGLDTRLQRVGSAFLMLPVRGAVTSPYGYRVHPIFKYWGLHDGVDFGAPCGEPLRAAATGTVLSTYYSKVYGNRLFLNVGQVNGRNVTLIYNHASGFRVGAGQRVSRGEVLGFVGDTGWSTGCHLHYTVLVDGSPADPMDWS